MTYNETPTTERETMTTKFKPWPKPVTAPTTSTEDFGNGIFIEWKF